ncbi:G-protein coupled receptor GRL101 [Biomphalaria glabrata]|nr:G-protein coupled receptor GRL101 [Biomphalaria glabrata]
MDASALCGNHNDSELVTLESKEEQAFLSSKIKVQQYTSHNNISVCIGLRREEHTLGRRFRWINQMPLVHTSWGRRHPKNGPSFRCKSGKCIGKEHKCDLYKDCEDGDDEQDCFKCQHALCSDGRCLPKHWLGDGEVDCDTCTDDDIELEMKASGDEDITKCVFLCNKTKCVYEAMLHDGVLDCRGPEGPLDETLGALASTVCYQKEYPSLNYSNWAPKCVYIKDDFEELIGCRNMKHLEDCQNFECPEGYVKCPEAYCIPLHYVNNNKYDCPNGEDESTSIALECPGYFMCDNNQRQKMCLHPDFVCDGKEHCPEGEDEINCNVQCLTGLLCVSGAVVVIDPSAEVDLNLIDVRTRYIDISETNAPNVFSVQPAHSFNNLIEARFVYDRKAFGMGYGHFVLNLGLSDFLMGVYLIIVASADMHYRGSYLWGEQGWRSSVTCKASGFLSTLSNETSIFFIFLITLDRFLVIRFPFGQVKIRSRVAIAICVVTWSVGIALALIPGLHYFGHWSVYTTTGVCVGLPLNPLADTAWLYSQSIFIYVNFLLFLLITAGQVVIYKTMSKMRVEKECLTNVGKRRLQDITVAKNLLLVVVTNFLCWFPIGLLGVMTLCGYQMDKDVYAWTAVLVLPINSAINPILYTVPSIVQNYQKSNEQTMRPSSQTTSV